MAPANRRQKPWMSHVQATAIEKYRGDPITEPIYLELFFHLPRPKSHFGSGKNSEKIKDSSPKKHVTTPDLTKLLRAVEDALTGIIWKDDSQVCGFMCSKAYTLGTPGVDIRIKGLGFLE